MCVLINVIGFVMLFVLAPLLPGVLLASIEFCLLKKLFVRSSHGYIFGQGQQKALWILTFCFLVLTNLLLTVPPIDAFIGALGHL
jgi:hypothetical protein